MRQRQHGFTLIELLTVMIVAGLVLAAAIPAFTLMMNDNRLSMRGNDLAATVQTMRMEAVRTGRRVIICPTDNNTSCATGARWNGWMAFRDDNANNAPSTAEIRQVERVRIPLELWASPAIASTGNRIVLRPDGLAYDNAGDLLSANLGACLPTETPERNVRDIFIGPGGNIGVSSRDNNALCNAPADP